MWQWITAQPTPPPAPPTGEYLEFRTLGAATNFPASNSYGDFGSLVLNPGDWDVTFIGDNQTNTATGLTSWIMGIGNTAGNSADGLLDGHTQSILLPPPTAASGHAAGCVAAVRRNVTVATTIFAKILAVYATGQPRFTGRISARRLI